MKLKHILGTVTIVAVIGGTIYAIKKSKDLKKSEGEAITLAEARRIVAEKDFDKSFEKTFGDKDLVEYSKADAEAALRIYKEVTTVEARPYSEESFDPEDEEEEEILMEDNINIFQRDIEEADELRHEPNSKEARMQYIKMELAEWVPLEDNYQTLSNLFEFPFHPQNDGDEMLRTQIIDFKAHFFGHASRWTREVTYADIILHYARAAEFNNGESVKYWADYFLEFNELDFTQPSHHIDELIKALNSHTYFNEERQTFGLFGLTQQSMDQAIRIANLNIDRSVTYEIEFNEFLKSVL
jgi:hypothetical protein